MRINIHINHVPIILNVPHYQATPVKGHLSTFIPQIITAGVAPQHPSRSHINTQRTFYARYRTEGTSNPPLTLSFPYDALYRPPMPLSYVSESPDRGILRIILPTMPSKSSLTHRSGPLSVILRYRHIMSCYDALYGSLRLTSPRCIYLSLRSSPIIPRCISLTPLTPSSPHPENTLIAPP